MKLHIFGSCSGTEPMPGRHHTGMAFDINGRIYWFDAGEGSSHTAHCMGVDLLSVTDVFISHPHMDHIGGLGNLLWNMNKLTKVTGHSTKYGDVTVHIPVLESYDAIITLLKNTEGGYNAPYGTLGHRVTDGVVLKNGDVTVTAIHNTHLPKDTDGWRSFTFLIEAEGKRIIYSGDVGGVSDIEPLFDRECDLLLMETGHHIAEEVCQKVITRGYPVKSICFVHHGLATLADPEGTLERCRKIFPDVRVVNDAETYEIS